MNSPKFGERPPKERREEEVEVTGTLLRVAVRTDLTELGEKDGDGKGIAESLKTRKEEGLVRRRRANSESKRIAEEDKSNEDSLKASTKM